VVLVFQRAGELAEQLRQHAGHGGEGGDDLGGVAGFDDVAGAGTGAMDEPADGVLADGEILVVGAEHQAGHQNGGWSSAVCSSAA
jgi:hypothetical protein